MTALEQQYFCCGLGEYQKDQSQFYARTLGISAGVSSGNLPSVTGTGDTDSHKNWNQQPIYAFTEQSNNSEERSSSSSGLRPPASSNISASCYNSFVYWEEQINLYDANPESVPEEHIQIILNIKETGTIYSCDNYLRTIGSTTASYILIFAVVNGMFMILLTCMKTKSVKNTPRAVSSLSQEIVSGGLVENLPEEKENSPEPENPKISEILTNPQ